MSEIKGIKHEYENSDTGVDKGVKRKSMKINYKIPL